MAGTIAEGVKSARSAPRFAFRLAERGDDAALRELLHETPMDGPIRVALCREPNYFDAAAVEGPLRQTLVVTDAQSGKIVGMGARSVRNRFVDGVPTPVGYLSGLRILPQYRSGTLLARGYRQMRQMHEDGATDFYVTTIAEGNTPANNSLTGGRAGLPHYHAFHRYHTFVVPLRRTILRRASTRDNVDLEIRPLRKSELPSLVDFVTDVGRRRSLFPCYGADDLSPTNETFRGLAVSDILTAWRGGQLIACLGLWNQTSFKQSVVCGYRWHLRWGRLAFNPIARCLGWPRFPSVGQALPSLTIAFPLTRSGDTEAFTALLDLASQQARAAHPSCESLLIGMCESDPLFETCRRASLYSYVTRIYVVSWDEGALPAGRFDQSTPYLELGCL